MLFGNYFYAKFATIKYMINNHFFYINRYFKKLKYLIFNHGYLFFTDRCRESNPDLARKTPATSMVI